MKVGQVIARLDTTIETSADEAMSPDPSSSSEEKKDETTTNADEASEPTKSAEEKEDEKATESSAVAKDQKSALTGIEKDSDKRPAPAAPSIRRLARELGVDIHDVSGTGPGKRITEADVKTHVRNRQPGDSMIAGPQAAPETPAMPDFSRWGEVHAEEMETVRLLTARSTAASWATIPHVTQFDETDITAVTGFIEKNAPKVEKAGAKLTVTAIITRVCAEALKRFPRFNASIDVANRRIILKRYVHIGIAADTPRGLLVPVIRDADRMSIVELAKAIGDLAQRARNKKIKPDELEGGTFSISNQGGIGGVGFTPIVLWPQVAILGVSRSAVKPVFVNDRFEPRTILPLSLSYDHRIIDGADAARFLRWICDGLEQPMTLFLD
jgi:pyruvate dehydrogenase E2 component (dihydrolipoamide acetyltransferase)